MEKTHKVKDKVIQYFNAHNADSLYNLAGDAFKKQFTADNFKIICQNNLFPLGEIKTAEFEKSDKGVCKYKTTFEKGIFSMYISLDSDNKLETFLFQPYKKEASDPGVKSATDNKLTTELDKKIEDIIQPFMGQSKTVGLSIGVIKNGQFYFYNYGATKKGSSLLPTALSLYEIGSVTKTFTGLLLAKAVIEKKISLNDPVNKYLPKNIPLLAYGNDTLKIIHLSNHTSGLPSLPGNFNPADLTNPYKDYDEKKLLEYLLHASLTRKPGEKMEYSNLGVGLLGYILEEVNKMSFEKMVSTYICSKAGMTDTRQLLIKNDSALFVPGYNESISPQSQWDFKVLAAAGCLRSNTTDMLKFAALQLGTNDVTLQKAIALAQQATFNDGQQQLGLNWFIQNWGWGEILFNGGQTGAYKSFFAINPKTKNAVVILSNTAVNNDAAGMKILRYLDN